jgi:hypothetical protein
MKIKKEKSKSTIIGLMFKDLDLLLGGLKETIK